MVLVVPSRKAASLTATLQPIVRQDHTLHLRSRDDYDLLMERRCLCASSDSRTLSRHPMQLEKNHYSQVRLLLRVNRGFVPCKWSRQCSTGKPESPTNSDLSWLDWHYRVSRRPCHLEISELQYHSLHPGAGKTVKLLGSSGRCIGYRKGFCANGDTMYLVYPRVYAHYCMMMLKYPHICGLILPPRISGRRL